MPEELNLESLRSSGPAEGETLQPEDAAPAPAGAGAAGGAAAAAAAAAPAEPDATIVTQLVSMGFSENGSKRAGACVARVRVWVGVRAAKQPCSGP
jgi:ubiquitin carboxyl-terminal hydrolase 5/13